MAEDIPTQPRASAPPDRSADLDAPTDAPVVMRVLESEGDVADIAESTTVAAPAVTATAAVPDPLSPDSNAALTVEPQSPTQDGPVDATDAGTPGTASIPEPPPAPDIPVPVPDGPAPTPEVPDAPEAPSIPTSPGAPDGPDIAPAAEDVVAADAPPAPDMATDMATGAPPAPHVPTDVPPAPDRATDMATDAPPAPDGATDMATDAPPAPDRATDAPPAPDMATDAPPAPDVAPSEESVAADPLLVSGDASGPAAAELPTARGIPDVGVAPGSAVSTDVADTSPLTIDGQIDPAGIDHGETADGTEGAVPGDAADAPPIAAADSAGPADPVGDAALTADTAVDVPVTAVDAPVTAVDAPVAAAAAVDAPVAAVDAPVTAVDSAVDVAPTVDTAEAGDDTASTADPPSTVHATADTTVDAPAPTTDTAVSAPAPEPDTAAAPSADGTAATPAPPPAPRPAQPGGAHVTPAPRPGRGGPGSPGSRPKGRPGSPGSHGSPHPRPSAIPLLVGVVEPVIEPVDPHLWGRIDGEGVVYVTTAVGERPIGVWQAGDAEAGLAHFGRRFDDFATEIAVLEARLASGTGDPKATKQQALVLRESVDSLAAIGDLDGTAARLETVIGAADLAIAGASQARHAARAAAIKAKEALCEEAEGLAESTQWKSTGDRLKAIVDEWRQIRGIDRKTDDALWKRFAKARDTFTRHRGSHFAELDKQRGAAKDAKEALIARAEALSTATDWNETAAAYRSLMAEWKAAGRAPRDVEDALWARFRAAQEAFFSRRNKTFSDRDAEFVANAAVKEQLLAEAERIDPAAGLTTAKATLRSIQERWEAAGKVPRERIRELDGRLRAVEERVRSADERLWRRSDPETSARVEQFRSRAEGFRAQAAKARAAGDERKARDAEKQAEQWEVWLKAARGAVER